MGIRLDTTEQEFGVALEKAFAGRIGAGDIAAMVRGFKKLLDLEFQESGRGEGVPEEIGCRPIGPTGAREILDGETGDQIGVVAPSNEPTWAALEKALGAYNDFPALLALARELEEEVAWWQGRFGYETPRGAQAVGLINRARAFLAPLEGGRE